jgi:hypothetical protein
LGGCFAPCAKQLHCLANLIFYYLDILPLDFYILSAVLNNNEVFFAKKIGRKSAKNGGLTPFIMIAKSLLL